MKAKTVAKRFNGPWTVGPTPTVLLSPEGLMDLGDAIDDYNKLLDFTGKMAKEFSKAAPEQFRKFYYENK